MPALCEQMVNWLESSRGNRPLIRNVEKVFYFNEVKDLRHPLVESFRQHLVLTGEDFPQGIATVESFRMAHGAPVRHLCIGREITDRNTGQQIYLGLRGSPEESALMRFDCWPMEYSDLKARVPGDHRATGIPISGGWVFIPHFLGLVLREMGQ